MRCNESNICISHRVLLFFQQLLLKVLEIVIIWLPNLVATDYQGWQQPMNSLKNDEKPVLHPRASQDNSRHESAPAGCAANTLATFLKCGSRKRLNASHDIPTTSHDHPTFRVQKSQEAACSRSSRSRLFLTSAVFRGRYGHCIPCWIPYWIATECQQVRGQASKKSRSRC